MAAGYEIEDYKAKIASATLRLENTRTNKRLRSKITKMRVSDARDEIVYRVVTALRPGIPPWLGQLIGYSLADKHVHDLCTVPPESGNADSIAYTRWNTGFLYNALQYFHALVTGVEPIPRKPANWDQFPYSTYESRHCKNTMEDKMVVLSSLSVVEPTLNHEYKDAALFAVFDGHGGPECADFAASHFPPALIKIQPSTTPHDEILKQAFGVIDKEIDTFCRVLDVAGGSTASVALILEGVVHYAWVGDSGMGVMKGKEIIQLNKFHNLQSVEEEQRIIAAGGCVLNIMGEPRVDGVLNITRAFGHPHANSIIGVPDTGKFTIGPDDYLLLIASDGIWDSIEQVELFDLIVSYIRECSLADFDIMAHKIGEVIRQSSADNCMLLIIALKPVEDIWSHFASVPVAPPELE